MAKRFLDDTNQGYSVVNAWVDANDSQLTGWAALYRKDNINDKLKASTVDSSSSKIYYKYYMNRTHIDVTYNLNKYSSK